MKKEARKSLCLMSALCLWRRHVSPKRRLTFNGQHGVISQKTWLFITAAVRTWNLGCDLPYMRAFDAVCTNDKLQESLSNGTAPFYFLPRSCYDANAPEDLRVATAVQAVGPCRQALLSVTCVGGQPLIAEQEPTGSWPSGQGVKEESLLPIQNWQQGNSRRSSLLTGTSTALHRHRNHFRDLLNITQLLSKQWVGGRKVINGERKK
jgi:hypothetical protein